MREMSCMYLTYLTVYAYCFAHQVLADGNCLRSLFYTYIWLRHFFRCVLHCTSLSLFLVIAFLDCLSLHITSFLPRLNTCKLTALPLAPLQFYYSCRWATAFTFGYSWRCPKCFQPYDFLPPTPHHSSYPAKADFLRRPHVYHACARFAYPPSRFNPRRTAHHPPTLPCTSTMGGYGRSPLSSTGANKDFWHGSPVTNPYLPLPGGCVRDTRNTFFLNARFHAK